MSKHIFTATIDQKNYEIQIGWDKPTQEYYGMILGFTEDPTEENGGYFDDMIWSSMFSTPPIYTLEDIENEISKRGFIIPEGLLTNVVLDMHRNAVNEHRFYNQPEPIKNTDNNHMPLLEPKMNL